MFGGLRQKDQLHAAVASEDGRVLKAVGYIRMIPEVVFQACPGTSKRERSAALKMAIAEMKKVLAGRCNEAVLFAESLEFATILCAHFDGTHIDAVPVALEV